MLCTYVSFPGHPKNHPPRRQLRCDSSHYPFYAIGPLLVFPWSSQALGPLKPLGFSKKWKFTTKGNMHFKTKHITSAPVALVMCCCIKSCADNQSNDKMTTIIVTHIVDSRSDLFNCWGNRTQSEHMPPCTQKNQSWRPFLSYLTRVMLKLAAEATSMLNELQRLLLHH